MGTTKSDLFTTEQNRLAELAKAIAHPARVAILQHLAQKKACVCGDLVGVLGLAQATTSQHLKELKNAGLIMGTVEGTNVCYCINPAVWATCGKLFGSFFTEYSPAESCC